MTQEKNSLLNHKYLNGWKLLGLVSLVISLIVIIPFMEIDASNPAHISVMIATSVRTAVPWLFLAFAASSLVHLFPNSLTKWIMRNRKIFGLCFATGMAWQLFFIVWFVIGSFDYYMEEAYAFHSLVEQLPGYLILIAMTITSFRLARKKMSGKNWRLLHKGGMYLLWGILFSTYWYELFYYTDIQPIDHIYYWMGFGAWLSRIGSWTKKRRTAKQFKLPSGEFTAVSVPKLAISAILVIIGMFMVINGQLWAPQTLDILNTIALGEWIEHFISFVPMIPLSIAFITFSKRQHIN
ncbi:MAG: hypothetical protein HOJ34_01285 [Kordiimonadaceae bacterium]|jgi:methionine sulfoxide reductase heme-binding subunit|nr:hypothetical protein [Gammaproteobacteria bacterium]MBT5073702.1 hypothetical protein [Kordiimonadaceae bacterium]MBT6037331.1 hypothetical protein [Kordiimonadaceae bacterium]MBT6328389.1 hypothetical protein [Kordiimonadaceae bacterium]MBT7583306.1 hypothetical protein [Kordiimonadaceae bacterium]